MNRTDRRYATMLQCTAALLTARMHGATVPPVQLIAHEHGEQRLQSDRTGLH
jgi:hypothetical protein